MALHDPSAGAPATASPPARRQRRRWVRPLVALTGGTALVGTDAIKVGQRLLVPKVDVDTVPQIRRN